MAIRLMQGRVNRDREVGSEIDLLNRGKPWHWTFLAQSSIQFFFGSVPV